MRPGTLVIQASTPRSVFLPYFTISSVDALYASKLRSQDGNKADAHARSSEKLEQDVRLGLSNAFHPIALQHLESCKLVELVYLQGWWLFRKIKPTCVMWTNLIDSTFAVVIYESSKKEEQLERWLQQAIRKRESSTSVGC